MELARKDKWAFAECVGAERAAADVMIVMRCLNEIQSLPQCMANALDALARLRTELGMSGEVVMADHGSTDGGRALAETGRTRRGDRAALWHIDRDGKTPLDVGPHNWPTIVLVQHPNN